MFHIKCLVQDGLMRVVPIFMCKKHLGLCVLLVPKAILLLESSGWVSQLLNALTLLFHTWAFLTFQEVGCGVLKDDINTRPSEAFRQKGKYRRPEKKKFFLKTWTWSYHLSLLSSQAGLNFLISRDHPRNRDCFVHLKLHYGWKTGASENRMWMRWKHWFKIQHPHQNLFLS